MTTPCERTKAVTDTRELLTMLARADEITIGGLVQTVALGLLRHYPLDIDLDVSAAALPGIWAASAHRQAGSTTDQQCKKSTSCQDNADDVRSRGEGDDRAACRS